LLGTFGIIKYTSQQNIKQCLSGFILYIYSKILHIVPLMSRLIKTCEFGVQYKLSTISSVCGIMMISSTTILTHPLVTKNKVTRVTYKWMNILQLKLVIQSSVIYFDPPSNTSYTWGCESTVLALPRNHDWTKLTIFSCVTRLQVNTTGSLALC